MRDVRDEFGTGPLFLDCLGDRLVHGFAGDREVSGEGLERGGQAALVDRDIGVCAGGGDDLIEPPQVLDQPGQDIEVEGDQQDEEQKGRSDGASHVHHQVDEQRVEEQVADDPEHGAFRQLFRHILRVGDRLFPVVGDVLAVASEPVEEPADERVLPVAPSGLHGPADRGEPLREKQKAACGRQDAPQREPGPNAQRVGRFSHRSEGKAQTEAEQDGEENKVYIARELIDSGRHQTGAVFGVPDRFRRPVSRDGVVVSVSHEVQEPDQECEACQVREDHDGKDPAGGPVFHDLIQLVCCKVVIGIVVKGGEEGEVPFRFRRVVDPEPNRCAFRNVGEKDVGGFAVEVIDALQERVFVLSDRRDPVGTDVAERRLFGQVRIDAAVRAADIVVDRSVLAEPGFFGLLAVAVGLKYLPFPAVVLMVQFSADVFFREGHVLVLEFDVAVILVLLELEGDRRVPDKDLVLQYPGGILRCREVLFHFVLPGDVLVHDFFYGLFLLSGKRLCVAGFIVGRQFLEMRGVIAKHAFEHGRCRE